MRLLYASRSWVGHDTRFFAAWQAGGVEVAPVTVDGSGPGEHGGSIEDYPRRIRAAIAEFRPTLVQAGPLTDVAPAVMAEWAGPVMAMSWGFDLMSEVSAPDAREKVEQVLATADLVVVDNDAPASVALGLGVDPQKLVQFPWGVDVDFFVRPADRPLRRPWCSPSSEFIVLSSRRHERIYGVNTVIDGFILAAARSSRLRLRLAGSGSLTPELRSRISAAGLSSRVDFVGELTMTELRQQLLAADVYVTASHVDGSSVSLLEAMAAGTPVVASRIPGNRQWVKPATGFGFNDGDELELAGLLERLAGGDVNVWTDVATRVAAARSLVVRKGNWKRTVGRLPGLAGEAIRRWETVD